MKKRFRVRSKAEFQRLYQEGRSYANRAAVIYVQKSPGASPRVGVAAGRKLGGAVVRNRLKRRLREAVRQFWPRIRPGALFLVIARAGAKDMPYQQLLQKIHELLDRAGLLAGEPGNSGEEAP